MGKLRVGGWVIRHRNNELWSDVGDMMSWHEVRDRYMALSSGERDRYDVFPVGDVNFRRLHEVDIHFIMEHFMGMDDADRRSRFHGCVSQWSIEEHYRKLDWKHSILLGCFHDGKLVGMSEAIFETNEKAEISVSVDSRFRSGGMGRDLVRYAAEIAIIRGAKNSDLYYVMGTLAIPRIVKSLGGTIDFMECVGHIPSGSLILA